MSLISQLLTVEFDLYKSQIFLLCNIVNLFSWWCCHSKTQSKYLNIKKLTENGQFVNYYQDFRTSSLISVTEPFLISLAM